MRKLKENKWLVLVLGLALVILLLIAFWRREGTEIEEVNELNKFEESVVDESWNNEDVVVDGKAKQCQNMGGEYLAEYNECEWIGADECRDLGGEFVECGSACRHDLEAKVCILMCVPYCKL